MAPSPWARAVQAGARQVITSDGARELLGTAVGEAVKGIGRNGSKRARSVSSEDHNGGPLAGVRGIIAGAGAAALAPVAFKRAKQLVPGAALAQSAKAPVKALESAGSKLGDSLGASVGDKVSHKIDEAGGPSGILKDAVKSALPFGGARKDDDGERDDAGVTGVGKGRRMPVQQSIDVAVPLKTAYNQWTQFEEWPKFMHRVTRVTQEDECTVSFATKIWGKGKEFKAEIETQRPDERIKWRVAEGISHTGVVTFHELGPRLTRIELGLDLEPGGMLEKAARGMRHLKRAARADLHRFKAFIEMRETETGAWRGVIEDGKLKSRAARSKSSGSTRAASKSSGSRRAASKSSAPKSASSSRKRQSTSSNGSRSSAKRARSSSSRSRSSTNGHEGRQRSSRSSRRS